MSTLYEHADPAVRLFLAHETPQALFEDGAWNEGPCYFPASRTLIWSDIPNDRLMRFDEIAGHVCTFRTPSQNANGNTVDSLGRLITCEHGSRRVTRTEFDGRVSVLASSADGKRLNSPNDVVVRSDGTIWFSDPSYGIDSDYFGHRAPREQDGAHVFRLDPSSGQLDRVITTMEQPNGLAFSADETRLLVVDSGRTGGPDLPAHIRRFDIGPGGALADRGILADAPVGVFDGIRVDDEDRIWAGVGDGVCCFACDGRLLGRMCLGMPVINLCFGGPKLNILYMCTPHQLLRVPVRARGQTLQQVRS